MYFKNREQAGIILANQLFDRYRKKNVIVAAIPRGGIPVAQSIAYLLDAPLTVIAARKVSAPLNPEFGIGAVTEDGQVWIDYEELGLLKINQTQIDQSVERAMKEIKRQSGIYQHLLKPVEFRGRNVILVDDGLATGSTMLAAIRSLKTRGVKEITVAVPVASEHGIDLVKAEANFVVSVYTPQHFSSVGRWYEDFSQVTDEEVIHILETPTGEVEIEADEVKLMGELIEPKKCKGWIIFAHGSGSSRSSPRNIEVARKLNEAGFGTLLFDLLTEEEARNRARVFDIDFLARRLSLATRWLRTRPEWHHRPIGYFGASTGAGAALQSCAIFEPDIFCIVSRSGRPDLAKNLRKVTCPTLLVVGGEDKQVIELNQSAQRSIPNSKIAIIPGATHLFEEPGTLDQVVTLAKAWFEKHLNQHREEHHANP